MVYVVADIHNDAVRFKELIKRIGPEKDDRLILLGDLFDRCNYNPIPLEVYFTVLENIGRCTVIAGNHDRWLGEYIKRYYTASDAVRQRMTPYHYNSFDLLKRRLTQADMLALADWLLMLPLQQTMEIEGKDYLFAHAMTSDPYDVKADDYYLMAEGPDSFYTDGIEGYISFCGHSDTGYFRRYGGRYLDEAKTSIWVNDKENVYMMDCGCGYSAGRLACYCIETGERIYIS